MLILVKLTLFLHTLKRHIMSNSKTYQKFHGKLFLRRRKTTDFLTFLFLFIIAIYADDKEKSLEEWTNFGCGIGHALTKHGPGYNLNLSHNFGQKIFYQLAFSITDGSLNSRSFRRVFGIKPIQQHGNYVLNTFSISVGQKRMWNNYVGAIFFGPSFNIGKIKNPDVPGLIDDWSKLQGFGTMTNIQIIMRPKSLPDLALGTEFYANFNKAKNNYGYRLSVSFGNMTKRF